MWNEGQVKEGLDVLFNGGEKRFALKTHHTTVKSASFDCVLWGFYGNLPKKGENNDDSHQCGDDMAWGEVLETLQVRKVFQGRRNVTLFLLWWSMWDSGVVLTEFIHRITFFFKLNRATTGIMDHPLSKKIYIYTTTTIGIYFLSILLWLL